MLVESCKKENLVFLDRTANRSPALLLPAMRLKSHKSVSRAKSTVANVVKTRPVPVVRPRFSHDIHHRTTGPSLLRAIGIRRHAKLLHHFVRELVRRPVKPARLRKEGIVEVASIHQKTILKSPQPAK